MLLLLCCLAEAPAQTLRWAARSDAQSMDPHAALEVVTLNLVGLVYDALVEPDRSGQPVPALAERWSLPEPTRWRFELRRGVRFQDGTPFTADDVVFSIERAQQPTSRVAPYAVALGTVRRIDEHTVELVQPRPDPLLLEKLSRVLIMSRAWTLAHGGERVPDLKAGGEAYTNRHAMGTGRFLLRRHEPGVATHYARNPAHWGRFDGNVEQIVYLPIASDATRTAGLLAGDFDFLQDVPAQDANRLARDPRLRLQRGVESRLIYFGMDQSADRGGRANPLRDVRVREALQLGIDAEALRRHVMRDETRISDCIAPSPAACFDPGSRTRAAPDLPRARRLLAEAGFADGLDLTLDCPNDRYVNDQALCVAAGGMLARIGVRVKVDARPKGQHFARLQRRESQFFLHGYGYGLPDPQPLLEALAHTPDGRTRRGDGNYGRFSDAEIDRLLDEAATDMDEARRRTMLARAQALLRERRYLLPLHYQGLTWAARRDLAFVMTPDNVVRPDWMRFDE